MSIKKLNPYLNFDGTAAQAIALYERALGAKVENAMKFGDVPGMKVAKVHEERVMHACLTIGEGIVMISDSMPGMPFSAQGNNTHICVEFDDADDMAARFDALAQGGSVTMALHDAFWGARFGMLTDAYGIHWMFTCENKS